MTVDKETIYVAGNPNLFPLEYYNTGTKKYEGAIPNAFKKFSESSDYQIVYIDTDGKDLREEKYYTDQVEIISGWIKKKNVIVQEGEEKIGILEATLNGEKNEYCILLTRQADEKLKNELRNFFEEEAQEEKTGTILVEVENKTSVFKQNVMMHISTVLILMACLLLGVMFLYARKIRKMRKLSLFDTDTGIGNQAYLLKYYDRFVNANNRVLYWAVYLTIDYDYIYRQSNGIEANLYLKYVVSTLKQSVNKSDILVRISGGDFFILKLEPSEEKMNIWVQDIIDALRKYSLIYDKNFQSFGWAGIYALKKNDNMLDKIIFKAKQSCIYAKENHKMYYKCTDEIMDAFEEKIRLEERIKKAFHNDEFIFHLQFLVDSRNDKIIGAEALSRWQHPYEGLLFPKKYISIMEKNETIERLDFDILNKMCCLLEKIYKNNSQANFLIFCNFSRKTFLSIDFLDKFMNIINGYCFPHNALFLELTEMKEYEKFEVAYQNIETIRNLGIRVIMDDYGTGYAKLENLDLDKFDGIKIDKKLIKNLNTKMGKVLIKAIIDMCKGLDKYVLADGVESEWQATLLKNMGCDYIQGDYFYYPMPEEEAKVMYIIQRVKSLEETI